MTSDTRTAPTLNAGLLLARDPDMLPSRPKVAQAVIEASVGFAADLDVDGQAHIELEPGDATRYPISVMTLPVEVGAYRGGAQLVVYRDRALTITVIGLITPDYLASRLGITNQWTANVLALFLTSVGDRRTDAA